MPSPTVQSENVIIWYFYYPIKLNGYKHYIIWYSNDESGLDQVYVNKNNEILYFDCLRDCKAFFKAEFKGQKISNAITLDLNKLIKWLEKPSLKPNYKVFLDAWNLFGDVARTIKDFNFDEDKKKSKKVYDKLFWGNNLPSITPEGEKYIPSWTKIERKLMVEILSYGIEMLKTNLKKYEFNL